VKHRLLITRNRTEIMNRRDKTKQVKQGTGQAITICVTGINYVMYKVQNWSILYDNTAHSVIYEGQYGTHM